MQDSNLAGFKAHLTGGILNGTAFSLLAFFGKALTLSQVGVIFILGSVAGLLPDLDHDTGKPLTLLFQILSVLIPAILFWRAAKYGGDSPEFIVLYFALSYVFVRYVVCYGINKLSAHRGMMHSIPFALLCGLLGYLFFISSGTDVALIVGISILSGCMVHLVLDELHSFTLKYGFIPNLKRSSGTALKIKANTLGTTLIVYVLILLVAVAILFSLS